MQLPPQMLLQKHGDRAVIYVCGGDGTSHDRTEIGLQPAHMGVSVGTANDFAKTFTDDLII